MAYENYNIVSWTNGTPLTGERLAQMSTNIEQVKAAVDDKSTGILKYNQLTAAQPNTVGWADYIEHEVITLKDESGTGGSDRRVSIGSQRYYKVTLNIPAITILAAGSEDSKFTINLYNGLSGGANSKIAYWDVTPSPYTYINVAAALPSIANHTLKGSAYPTKMAGGTYSVLLTAVNALTNQSFYATVTRTQGVSNNNAPKWYIVGDSSAPIQLYVEDVGGI